MDGTTDGNAGEQADVDINMENLGEGNVVQSDDPNVNKDAPTNTNTPSDEQLDYGPSLNPDPIQGPPPDEYPTNSYARSQSYDFTCESYTSCEITTNTVFLFYPKDSGNKMVYQEKE